MKRVRIVVGLAFVALSAIGVACVLADPPPLANPPAPGAPKILSGSVSPPLAQKILAPPPNTPLDFSVPVEATPSVSLTFRVFIDWVATSTSAPSISVTDDGGATGALPDSGDSVRVFDFKIPPSQGVDFSVCHTITFFVAYAFQPNSPSVPVSPGGDQATWYYEPVSDCTFDNGAPPTGSDGASE
jgi:hypothetical protein